MPAVNAHPDSPRGRLGVKLLATSIAVGLVLALGIAALSILSGSRALTAQATEGLMAVQQSRQRAVEDYFRTKHRQAKHYARYGTVITAAEDFASAYRMRIEELPRAADADARLESFYETTFRTELERRGGSWQGTAAYFPTTAVARQLQLDYIVANPHPLGSKDAFETAGDATTYDRVHAMYHPALRSLVEDSPFYDLFLFDTDGRLVYAVSKETDFATDFLNGPHRDSGLATAVRRALESTGPGHDAPRRFLELRTHVRHAAELHRRAAHAREARSRRACAADARPADQRDHVRHGRSR